MFFKISKIISIVQILLPPKEKNTLLNQLKIMFTLYFRTKYKDLIPKTKSLISQLNFKSTNNL